MFPEWNNEEIADVVILDENGSMSLPVNGGTRLTENLVGEHFGEYNSYLVLWKSYVNFCNLYSFYCFMAVMSCREGTEGSKSDLFRNIVHASRGIIHNRQRQAALRDEYFRNDSATLAHMAVLLGG